MQAFYTLAQQCKVLKLRIYIQFEQATVLPAFKGSMLHGWLGHAIKHIDERVFFALYGEHESQQPKPYVICPNEDHKTHWQEKELYYFDILLIGEVTTFAEILLEAIKYGQTLGFGKQKTPFSLVSISSVLPNSEKAGVHILPISQWLTLSEPDITSIELALHFTTPVRLKVHGKVLQHNLPELPFLLKHIARRFTQLCQFWVCDDPELLQACYFNLPILEQYEQQNHTHHEAWQRYSLKENNQIPFGGIKGQVSYYGEISQAIPWLQLGEFMHIGGKTTFGLGKYKLIY